MSKIEVKPHNWGSSRRKEGRKNIEVKSIFQMGSYVGPSLGDVTDRTHREATERVSIQEKWKAKFFTETCKNVVKKKTKIKIPTLAKIGQVTLKAVIVIKSSRKKNYKVRKNRLPQGDWRLYQTWNTIWKPLRIVGIQKILNESRKTLDITITNNLPWKLFKNGENLKVKPIKHIQKV